MSRNRPIPPSTGPLTDPPAPGTVLYLRSRPWPDRLRYLAEQLRRGVHWSAVAITLDALAGELEQGSSRPVTEQNWPSPQASSEEKQHAEHCGDCDCPPGRCQAEEQYENEAAAR